MARNKLDGVIEAVRYTPGGKIAVVRMYERHGVVWSDHILVDREELSRRLEQGRRLAVGERLLYRGSVFNTGTLVRRVQGSIVTEGQSGARDLLAGVQLF